MRSSLAGAIVVVVFLAAFGLSRREIPNEADADQVQPLPAGASSTNLDSIRALRRSIRRRIADSDTYLGYALAEGDSVLKRWRNRSSEPLTVFLSTGDVPGFSDELRSAVREAFTRWERVGAIPVVFRFVRDSSQAEVEVRWIESFAIRRTGQADVIWAPDGWLVRGVLTIATHQNDGRRVSRRVAYTVALHEIGHLLGLGHSDDPNDLMYPSTSVSDLTPRDRRTARLLYALPPGSVRDP